jgi:hypothetical protein
MNKQLAGIPIPVIGIILPRPLHDLVLNRHIFTIQSLPLHTPDRPYRTQIPNVPYIPSGTECMNVDDVIVGCVTDRQVVLVSFEINKH